MRLQPLQQLVACGHKGVGGGVVQRLVDLRVAVGARPAGVLPRLGLFLFFGAEGEPIGKEPIAALPLL